MRARRMEGHGILTLPNGFRYLSGFRDQPTGDGVMLNPSGDRWEGRIDRHVPTGRGIYTRPDRSRHEVVFEPGSADATSATAIDGSAPASDRAVEAAVRANLAQLRAAVAALGREDVWDIDRSVEWVFTPAEGSRTWRYPVFGTAVTRHDEGTLALRIGCLDGSNCIQDDESGERTNRLEIGFGRSDGARSLYLEYVSSAIVRLKELLAAPRVSLQTVCVFEQEQLRELEVRIDRETGDTTFAGKPFREVYPEVPAQYAKGQPWYTNSEPITAFGRQYRKFGLPRVMGAVELTRADVYRGTAIFVAVEGAAPHEFIFVPAVVECGFQPYRVEG